MRLFTQEEANEALTVVRPLVERLVAVRRDGLAATERVAALQAKVAGNGGSLDPRAVRRAVRAQEKAERRLAELVTELDGLGVQVKDLDRGLVDFPAVHPVAGDVVLLCWHLGEDEVAHWHGLEEGYAGRKLLPF
jgi:hypothetical protein